MSLFVKDLFSDWRRCRGARVNALIICSVQGVFGHVLLHHSLCICPRALRLNSMAKLGLCLQGSAIKIQAQFSNVYRKKSLHGLDTLISKNRSRGAGISGKLFQNRNRDPVIGLGREGRRLYPGDAFLFFPSETWPHVDGACGGRSFVEYSRLL